MVKVNAHRHNKNTIIDPVRQKIKGAIVGHLLIGLVFGVMCAAVALFLGLQPVPALGVYIVAAAVGTFGSIFIFPT